MPRYSTETLRAIAIALDDAGYIGLATTIYWWNNENVVERHLKARGPKESLCFKVMRSPIDDMPLYINNEDETVRIIATERLRHHNKGSI
jgi:hypothetical protein